MPTNIEIKARVENMQDVKALAERLSDARVQTLRQEDTFFNVASGRLKLRDFGDGTGELIYYHRPDTNGPKQSTYAISTTSQPQQLKTVLSQACGIAGVVRKSRLIYLVGSTRIHLDTVEELGDFLELEVILSDGQSRQEGEAVARELMNKLGINESDLIDCAYVDLLNPRNVGAGTYEPAN